VTGRADLWMALGMGLLGGFGHCAGMCGPLVAAVSLAAGPRVGARQALLLQLLYNAGRVTTYTFAGFLMGVLGTVVDVAARAAGLQGAVMVAAGAAMVILGLGAAGVAPWARRLEGLVSGRLFAGASGLLRGGGQGRAYALGLLLGFLPCGLSWSAFAGAAATGGPASGALYALVFGLATTPALLLVGGAATLLSARARGLLFRLGGLAAAAAGLVFLLRGLGVHAL
jgi:sulfite exporter TauE/SafE